uniref:Ribbon-helix-helix domain-containing protein n=2 Tax=Thermofilum pendens TaxID=2269 RepID=A0A7J3X8C3_THEPE
MPAKKVRFGVSLDKDKAEELTRLAEALGGDRSSLISMAVEEFLEERFHLLPQHSCEGVLVVSYSPEQEEKVFRVAEEFKDCILGKLHVHSSTGLCVEVIYVRASSLRIAELHSKMRKTRCRCRFVPSH